MKYIVVLSVNRKRETVLLNYSPTLDPLNYKVGDKSIKLHFYINVFVQTDRCNGKQQSLKIRMQNK